MLAEIGRGGHSSPPPPTPGRRPSSPPRVAALPRLPGSPPFLPVQAEGPEGASGRAGQRSSDDAVRGGLGTVGRLLEGTPRLPLLELALSPAAGRISQPSSFRVNPLQRLPAGERGGRW